MELSTLSKHGVRVIHFVPVAHEEHTHQVIAARDGRKGDILEVFHCARRVAVEIVHMIFRDGDKALAVRLDTHVQPLVDLVKGIDVCILPLW